MTSTQQSPLQLVSARVNRSCQRASTGVRQTITDSSRDGNIRANNFTARCSDDVDVTRTKQHTAFPRSNRHGAKRLRKDYSDHIVIKCPPPCRLAERFIVDVLLKSKDLHCTLPTIIAQGALHFVRVCFDPFKQTRFQLLF